MKSLILHLAIPAAMLVAPPLLSAQDETASLNLLGNPDATLEQKQGACHQLARIGTAKSVATLAALLAKPDSSHMARHALEQIPDPSADAALLDALPTLKGRLLIGVIDSIGVRGDPEAVPALASLLKGAEPEVAHAAAFALGEIGTQKSAAALKSTMAGASGSRLQAIGEALLRNAKGLEGQKRSSEALAIYKDLMAAENLVQQIRAAALRGAIRSGGKEGSPLLAAVLRANDDAMFQAAVGISMTLKAPALTQLLTDGLADLSAERQIIVVGALAERGDPAGGPALLKLLDSAEVPVRAAAAQSLTRLAYKPAVAALTGLLFDADGDTQTIARECLSNFPDEAADAAIIELIENGEPETRRVGTELIAHRRIDLAVPVLLKVASRDEAESVRVAALTTLRELAGYDNLDALLELLLKAESEAIIKAVRHALVVVCARRREADQPPPPECVDPLIAALEKSSGPAKAALIEVLRRVGGKQAEEAIRRAGSE